jgi:hypothetical protein
MMTIKPFGNQSRNGLQELGMVSLLSVWSLIATKEKKGSHLPFVVRIVRWKFLDIR